MDFVATIEKTRRDLLELTSRNRLVHTPLESKRTSWISIEVERSDQLFDLLVRQGRTMTFLPGDGDDAEDDHQEFIRVFDEADRPVADATTGEYVDGPLLDSELAKRHTDLFLQTRFAKDKLDKCLLRFFYDARTAEEEQGVSILYLACGFLKWREASSSKVNRFSPLLLIPVDLSRNSARSKFRLKFRDDEIVTNLSIQARLQQDFGIRLPNLPEDLQDDLAWSPTTYFDQIRELIAGREGWEVMDNEILLWFFSFTKFLMFRDLSPDAWPAESRLEGNELIRSLLGDGFGLASGLQPTLADDVPIDRILSPADVVHVTDADSSQAIVIDEIAKGRHLVVQGPPGTGKSQTITNAIAASVHAGKRVLFVSEKMAALEVVKRRLDQIGLGPMTLELHSHKARKKEVLEELKVTLEHGVPTGMHSVATDELRQSVVRLRAHDELLHLGVGKSGCSPYQAMGRLMQLRSSGRKAMKYAVPEITSWLPEEFQARKQVCEDLDRLLQSSGSPVSNPWRGVSCSPMTPSDLERLFAKLKELKDVLELLEKASTDLADRLGLSAATNLLDTSRSAQLASHIIRCPPHADRSRLADPGWEGDLTMIEKTLTGIRSLIETRAAISATVSDAAWDSDLNATRIALAAHGKRWLRFVNADFRRAVATLRGLCREVVPKDADERVQLVDQIIAVQKYKNQLEQNDQLGRLLLGRLWAKDYTPLADAEAVIAWVKQTAKSPFLKQHACRMAAALGDTQVLAEPCGRIAKQLKPADTQLLEIVETLKLDVCTTFGADHPRSVPLMDWLACMARWLDAPERLSHHLATHARIATLRVLGLASLADEVERGDLGAGDVGNQLEMIRSEAVLAEAWRERPQLAEFHGDSYEKLRARFAELDLQRIALSRLEVAKKHYENLPNTSADSGQVSIVRREINKQRRHMPIRRLLKEAGHAVQKIKPVFMMSPLSVAQFLEPGAVEFDLLVIDEASQVQPVDALGAIARSKQIVVVGDQRQLPPTNFFGRMSGDNNDDEDSSSATYAGDMESILGLCEAQGLPSRMLRWHYRSRHESLIAVSNRQFYNDQLFIVPSPLISGGPLGLKLRYIPNGCYDRGGSRQNVVEASSVVDAVMEHARMRPTLSLGVATFSTAQRDAIIDELELRRRDDPSIEDFFANGGPEPFFVKSLENVQGDQRDVIFISIGYAKDQDGAFFQNFGPLNRDGGQRRLNVLISRAATSCTVFTSIKADDIDLSATRSEGVAALKMYLNYAESGRLDATQSHGDADSIFEEQVAMAIRNCGLEVDHQIGIGGFYIDLAIRDPERRGRYHLGIECDGAQYHSARWVRDRDRIRQQVLEARGWLIHRIWSTDWFQRPEEQLARVLKSLDDAKLHWDKIDGSHAESATVIAGRITIKDVDGSTIWQRVALAEETSDANGKQGEFLYWEADFCLRSLSKGPAELTDDQLTHLIARVVKIESPIHVDEIARRCIKILGRGRLVESLRRRIDAAVTQLQSGNAVTRRGDFVYHGSQQDVNVRHRRHLDNANLRKVEFIAPEELQAAIILIVTDHIGTDEAETSASVAKQLGISNSHSLQHAIATNIQLLTRDKALCNRAGKLFVG